MGRSGEGRDSGGGREVKTLIASLISVALLQAGEPPLIPQPVLVIQQTGQLVFTDKSCPVPVVLIQKQGQQWITSTGQVLMPLNVQPQQKEGR